MIKHEYLKLVVASGLQITSSKINRKKLFSTLQVKVNMLDFPIDRIRWKRGGDRRRGWKRESQDPIKMTPTKTPISTGEGA